MTEAANIDSIDNRAELDQEIGRVAEILKDPDLTPDQHRSWYVYLQELLAKIGIDLA
jgi:hypothetical protein